MFRLLLKVRNVENYVCIFKKKNLMFAKAFCYFSLNIQCWSYLYIVYLVKMESESTIFVLKKMVKSCPEKMIFKSLHARNHFLTHFIKGKTTFHHHFKAINGNFRFKFHFDQVIIHEYLKYCVSKLVTSKKS